jgi:hypothetical protein
MRVLGLLLLACAHTAVAPTGPGCRLPADVDPSWLGPGQVVLLGEVHHSVEYPAIAGEVACAAAARGPVIVGVEIDAREQPRIDAWLRDGLVERLLEGPFWNRDPGDGRESEAMLALLTRVRALSLAGRDVSLVAFDSLPTDRDLGMAQTIEQARRARPGAAVVALVGNAHARNGFGVITTFARHLADHGVPLHTIDLAGSGSQTGFDVQRDPQGTTRSPRARPLTSPRAP